MSWIPSHQTLASHPKLRRAAHDLELGLPAMIGHLHLLWWWALDHAPDGDLSRFEPVDVALAAGYDGDPDRFVAALAGCGPADSAGFLEPGGDRLHDWDEYGGKVEARRQSARKAAVARWTDDADALPAHSGRNAEPKRTHRNRNADKRRVDKTKEPTGADAPRDYVFEGLKHAWGIPPDKPLTRNERGRLNEAAKQLREVGLDPAVRQSGLEVARRAKVWQARYPDTKVTPQALVSHWSSLESSNGRPLKVELCGRCDAPLDGAHTSESCDMLAAKIAAYETEGTST